MGSTPHAVEAPIAKSRKVLCSVRTSLPSTACQGSIWVSKWVIDTPRTAAELSKQDHHLCGTFVPHLTLPFVSDLQAGLYLL